MKLFEFSGGFHHTNERLTNFYRLVNKHNFYIPVVTSSYLIGGGDGFSMYANALLHHPGEVALLSFMEYFKHETPVSLPAEGR